MRGRSRSHALTERSAAGTCDGEVCIDSSLGSSSATTMNSIATVAVATCLLALYTAESRPTIYMLNENDKLEPALVPVSSTVIPMPVYKVGTSLVFATKKGGKPSEPGKLITGGKKTLEHDDNVAINIKQISKEEFETQA